MSREGSQAGGKGRVSLLARNLPMDMKCAARLRMLARKHALEAFAPH